MIRLHVIGLPHTKTSKEYLPCAFTQKVLNFCKMMDSVDGVEVIHYGAEGSAAACDEHVDVITDAEQRTFFGGDEWKRGAFFPVKFDASMPYWQIFNSRTIEEIRKRAGRHDIVCVIGGTAHKPIADALPDLLVVEFGIGYEGCFAKHKVFESYAWMHNRYGAMGIIDGEAFDAVIPNYYDLADFPLQEKKGDYVLMVARFIQRKGVQVAAEACRAAGLKLLIAGQGAVKEQNARLVGQDVAIEGDHIEHVGVIDVKERARLMGGARALIAPTLYIGPFEGVAIEAMLCGTPVVSSDWGAFAETVQDGQNGYRCRTLGEYAWALKNLDKLFSPFQISMEAAERYALDVVKYRYLEYFEELLKLWGKGWYDEGYTPRKRQHGNFL